MENNLEQLILAQWHEAGVPGGLNDVRAVMNVVQGNGKSIFAFIILSLLINKIILVAGPWPNALGITNKGIIQIFLACNELSLNFGDTVWNIAVQTYGRHAIISTK